MTRYVLGLRKAGAQTDDAVFYRTAVRTAAKIDVWEAGGDNITVILRAGKAITAAVLRRDAEKELRASRNETRG